MDSATGDRDEGERSPFPDWSGRIVVVAASGPSQNAEDLAQAKGRAAVIVINDTWRLAPWADALYACDMRWWVAKGPGPEFSGLRFQGHVGADRRIFDGCRPCNVRVGDHKMHFDGTRLGSGGNSGFQAINLAAVSGARRVVLTGFDMSIEAGVHWHGAHVGRLTNPDARMLKNCATLLDGAAKDLSDHGVEVVNASRQTALKAYRRVSIEEALSD